MFGGPVNGNSPHLRKSGSRPVFGDLGDVSTEEVLVHSAGSSEMKGITSPLASAVMMPPPTFLWRFKVLLFTAWGLCCCKIGWDSVMRMSADLRDLFLYEAFLYYNPLLLVTLMVWLWGINLWVFSQANVNYTKIFDLDQNHLTHREICKCAMWMTIVVPTSMTAYLYLYSDGEVSLAASQPVLLYVAVIMLLIFPFDIFYLSSRYYFLRTLWRIVLPLQEKRKHLVFGATVHGLAYNFFNFSVLTYDSIGWEKSVRFISSGGVKAVQPTHPPLCLPGAITFSDFFLADILTSMSKVLSDLERSVCRMVHRQEGARWVGAGPKPEKTAHRNVGILVDAAGSLMSFVATIAWFEADSVCGSHSAAIPVVLVLPYFFRLFQCLRQYRDTGEKSSLLNALKYSTAVPVIFLSALKYHVFPDKWTSIYRPLWLLSSVLNSMYSFYWDISRDWDMSCFTRIFKFAKPNLFSYLLHGRTWVYCWVIGSNLILRCTWTYKLSAHLRHNYLTVFTIAALEIFRRFQWVFFRVENEWNKMSTKSHIQLSESDKGGEDAKLLDSVNHNV